MKYNFDKIIDRKSTNSTKWVDMDKFFISNDLLPFWIADMDFEVCPEIVKSMRNVLDNKVYGYMSTKEDYFESACNWTEERHGYKMDPSTLVHTSGVVLSLVLCVELFTEKDDNIMISTPSYPPFFSCVLDNDRNLFLNELTVIDGRYSIDFEKFEKQIIEHNIKWYILCNPHNPTGRVWERKELNKIAEICMKHGVRVISDEIWRDLVYKEYKFTPFASLSKEVEDMTITCFSATKTFNLAGLQASFVSIPRIEEREKMNNTLAKYHIGRPNSFSMTAVETAFKEGKEWLNELINYLEGNLDFLCEYMKNNLPKVKFIRPEGTYLVWLDFSEYEIEDINLHLQEKGKIALNKGETFGDIYKDFARVNIACPREQLKEGIERLRNALI